jgi:hypothetical protein
MADGIKTTYRKRLIGRTRAKRFEMAARLKAKQAPSKKSARSRFDRHIEDALFAVAWPEQLKHVQMYRIASVQLTIHGEPSPSDVARVQEAFLDLVKAAGFVRYRKLPQRTGSAIIPIILFTTEPATAQEAHNRAADLRSALLQEADLKKTKSETLLNYAKAFSLIIASLGLVVSFILKFPEKITISPEGETTIQWSSPKPTRPEPTKTIKLKGQTSPPSDRMDD